MTPPNPNPTVLNGKALPAQGAPKAEPIERLMYLLFAGILIMLGILIWIEYRFPNDGNLFQVIAGLLTAFSGAFFGRMPSSHKTATTSTAGGTATAEVK